MNRKLILAASFCLAACSSDPSYTPYKEAQKLGGQMIPAQTLNNGRIAYMQYCRACHGEKGDGNGPAAPGLRPPPRNFTIGEFKFAGVLEGKLPRDEDLVRIVKRGLHGTAMLPWEVPDHELGEIIQYLKTLSDKWKEEDAVGKPVIAAADTWGEARKAAAVERGKKVYHGFAQCLSCHAAYATKQEIFDASKELTGNGTTDFRDQMYQPEIKETDYPLDPAKAEGPKHKVLPPDFLFSELRSIHKDTELGDIYRLLVSGVTGAAMPAWDPESMPDKTNDVWALAYYIRSLTDMKGTTAATRLRTALAAQPAFVPPAEAVPAPVTP